MNTLDLPPNDHLSFDQAPVTGVLADRLMKTLDDKIDQRNRINVGFVMHVMQVAGAEVLVTQIIEQLADQINPTIFCLDAIGELGEQLKDQGVPVVVLNRQPGLDFKIAKKLSSAVKEREIQILHAHQYTPFFYSALSRILYGNRSKILFTEHGRHYPDVVSLKRRIANKWFLQKQAALSTACCDFSTNALRSNEGFTKAFTLRNGVDLRNLAPRGDALATPDIRKRLGMKPDVPYAACIARFHPVKDHETLIQAWKYVNQSIPTAKLLLVGDGECRAQCEAQAKDLKLTDSIEFWGIRHDVPEILKAIDAFTLTSVSEAASLTLLEAMASGCPSVLTDVGGNGEHVTDGQEGFLAPRGDSEAIGKHLTDLLSNSEKAKSMGQKARQRVEREFDLKQIIDQYHELYCELASNADTRSHPS